MKITVLQENLHKAIGLVERFVSTKATLPILANILLSADKNGFFVTATNLETGIRVRVGAKIDAEGAITVPAKVFGEFVATLPTEKVMLELLDDQLTVACLSNQASFQTINAKEFPEFPVKAKEGKQNLSISLLEQAVERVGFAASSDDSRPVLTGMLWDVGKDSVSVVATDGYRLSKLLLPLDSAGTIEKTILLPALVLREVVRVFGELKNNEVSFSWSEKEKQVFFYSTDIEVVARVLDGEFPAYQAVIPTDQSITISLPKAGLLAAVKMAAIFARESANIIRWKFEANTLLISANSPQVGKNVSAVDYEGEGLEDKEIAFNSRYLLDLLSHITSEEVVFSMTESLKPGVFYEKGREKEFLHVIMPVRVQS